MQKTCKILKTNCLWLQDLIDYLLPLTSVNGYEALKDPLVLTTQEKGKPVCVQCG